MTQPAAASRRRVLAAIFRRKGGTGSYSGLFDDLDSVRRSYLSRKVELLDGELAIFGLVKSADDWLLLTTERLVWGQGGAPCELSLGAIRDAIVDLKALHLSRLTLLQNRQLQILTEEGVSTIELEPGLSFGGVWSILKNIGDSNRKKA